MVYTADLLSRISPAGDGKATSPSVERVSSTDEPAAPTMEPDSRASAVEQESSSDFPMVLESSLEDPSIRDIDLHPES
ncbi:hypothetical protein E2C01_009976 [Portunus trituberculatus]|uniref:Uncharacterized protein n=1 Tax=Portunus trituberculatus TaxID=210409 RepID=A0A5B7D775_PORTR|nr:hypothetical protein [Portunus trituberculatus]